MMAEHLNPDRHFLLKHIGFDKKIVKAKGHYLFDEQGEKYLDFLAQYGAVPFGHNPDVLWQSILKLQKNQEPSLVQPLMSPAAESLASELVKHAPSEMQYVTFTNSGAECVEAAIKLARVKTGRQVILSTHTGFHGKTLGAVKATGNPLYRNTFHAESQDFDHVDFNDLDALEWRLSQNDVAAFIVEPIQGEGGMIVADVDYLSQASCLCHKYGALLIVDEIQTGMGRTGALFALDQESDVDADIILLAKALGGGLVSLGAVLCKKSVWSEEFGLYHSSTFANNHLSCSVGLAALKHITEDNIGLLSNVTQCGEYLQQKLQKLVKKYPAAYESVSGKGLMWGLKLQPWSGENSYLMALASSTGNAVPLACAYLLNEHKILTAPVFNNSNVLRIEPSLTIDKREINLLLGALDQMGRAISTENYYELFGHVAGESAPHLKQFISKLDFSHKKNKPEENIKLNPNGKKGRFAFLIHPTEFDDLINCQPPAFELFNAEQQEKWRSWLTSWCSKRYEPGIVYHLKSLRSRQGDEVEGWLIACPLTPQQMMRLPVKRRQKLISQYIEIAKELEVDILGLGAFTSIITRAGVDIADCGINITTGNSLTGMVSAESLLKAATESDVDLGKATIGVVGASGSVGKIACKRLANAAPHMILFGNPANPKAMHKLEYFAGELYRDAILNHSQSQGIMKSLLAIKPLSYWQSLLKRYDNNVQQLTDFFSQVNFYFASENQQPPICVTTQIEDALKQCQLVLSATSQGKAFINPQDLANGAVVCDAARPPDVKKEFAAARQDIRVFEGGLLKLPENIRFGKDNVIGFPDGINLACLSETITLAFEKAQHNYSIGLDVPLDEAQGIFDAAVKHGFEVDVSAHSDEIPVNPQKILDLEPRLRA